MVARTLRRHRAEEQTVRNHLRCQARSSTMEKEMAVQRNRRKAGKVVGSAVGGRVLQTSAASHCHSICSSPLLCLAFSFLPASNSAFLLPLSVTCMLMLPPLCFLASFSLALLCLDPLLLLLYSVASSHHMPHLRWQTDGMAWRQAAGRAGRHL